MPKPSVRMRKLHDKVSEAKPLPLDDAIKQIKDLTSVKADRTYRNGRKRKGFDQTIELVVHLGIDPKQADQMIRGSVSLPHGIGRTVRVIAFCEGELAEGAKAAGAAEAGTDELIDRITKGWMEFDVAIAHPQLMGKVGKLGRVLGPQGKMPSPKSGTVTPDVVTAVREFVAGKIEFRNDDGGNVHTIVGKASFTNQNLADNVKAFIDHIVRMRPSTAKGTYIKRACICATMTPSVTLAL